MQALVGYSYYPFETTKGKHPFPARKKRKVYLLCNEPIRFRQYDLDEVLSGQSAL